MSKRAIVAGSSLVALFVLFLVPQEPDELATAEVKRRAPTFLAQAVFAIEGVVIIDATAGTAVEARITNQRPPSEKRTVAPQSSEGQ